MVWTWLSLLVFLLVVWISVLRELRTALTAYLVQTALVAALYAVDAARTNDVGMWIAFAGLVVIRGAVVPALVWKLLPKDVLAKRQNRFLVAPTWAVASTLVVGLMVGALVSVWHTVHTAEFGFALATLFAGIVATALSPDPGKQMIGLLGSENGVDLAVAAVLARVSAAADYTLFVDIALVVLLFVVLIRQYTKAGPFTLRDYHQLRG